MTQDPRELLPLVRDDLACYCTASSPEFQLAAHIRLIVDKLEAVERGEIRRLMIFMPPRHGKSFLTAQHFPAWYLGRHPERSVISASYAQDLADDFGRKVRNLLVDPLHRAAFPECRISEDSASLRRFNTSRGGSYFAVGRGAAITGRGAHLLLIDDPLKDKEEAYSETIRRQLQDWYSHVAYTRLQPDAAVVLIETRWHLDDLAGWLLREHLDERWDLLSLPAIAEKDESFRKEGEALWPQKYPLTTLEQIRQATGTAWQPLYQQRPIAAEGAIFQRQWWRFYRERPKFTFIVQAWDTAFKTGAENDYSVGTTWGVSEYAFYLLSVWRGRVEFPELKRQLQAQVTQWKPNVILIEDKASGQSLIQELKRGTNLPVQAERVDSDKVTRAQAVTPMIEAGKVFLPEGASWLGTYLDEMSGFPAAPHDDSVDSTTIALNYLRRKSQQSGLIEYYKKQAERNASAGGLCC